jgi:hypothetical protein
MGLDESYQSRRLRWDICFDQNAARNIQDTNSGLLERDVQCNVLIHDRSPGNKLQRQTWWHASRAESGRADYPMCGNFRPISNPGGVPRAVAHFARFDRENRLSRP